GAVVVRRGAPAGGEARLQHEQLRRAEEHLARVAADAGDEAERAVDLGQLVTQAFKNLAHSVHRVRGFARSGDARYQLMYFHRLVLLCVGDLQHQLAEVFATEELVERGREILDARDDILPRVQLAFLHPLRDVPDGGRVALG